MKRICIPILLLSFYILGLPIHTGVLDYYQQGLDARKEGHYAEATMLFERLTLHKISLKGKRHLINMVENKKS